MRPEDAVVLEIFGEGPADIGEDRISSTPSAAEEPSTGVVPILVHVLCGRPASLRVKRKRFAFLQGKRLWQKVHFAKRQAYYNRSSGAVFVVDSEGDAKVLAEKKAALEKGRDQALPEFPMAVGLAQPCIEAWLLADAAAIRRARKLSEDPDVPPEPEQLPAPKEENERNPKAALGRAAGARGFLRAKEMWEIAAAVRDTTVLRNRCPLGFAPFADEVDQRIRPLF